MKFTLEINEVDNTLTDSTGKDVSELGLCLQIYQDLCQVKHIRDLEQEDELIRKMLEQILDVAYNGNIPVAGEYKKNEQ
tara:strand:+ start:922 stop:1158 length:237 start_codon:yes stop_codon:yes gene_type:complete